MERRVLHPAGRTWHNSAPHMGVSHMKRSLIVIVLALAAAACSKKEEVATAPAAPPPAAEPAKPAPRLITITTKSPEALAAFKRGDELIDNIRWAEAAVE